MNWNKIFLAGNITKDIELKYTSKGEAMASFSIAINETYKDKEGEQQKETTFIKIQAWGKTAENINAYCGKGSNIFVEGRIKTYNYEKDGEKKISTYILARMIQFLDKNKQSQEQEKDIEC